MIYCHLLISIVPVISLWHFSLFINSRLFSVTIIYIFFLIVILLCCDFFIWKFSHQFSMMSLIFIYKTKLYYGDMWNFTEISVDVLLKATGDAPIMKKKKWAVEGEKPVGWVAEFIRRYLKLEASDSLVSKLLMFKGWAR